jgi:DNA sulfur modification protein DndB
VHLEPAFEYVFPAIRGTQANHEYYVSMCPLKLIPKIFVFDDEELTPELRAQRILNKNRIPEMARYIVDNRNNYVFSAITASVNGTVKFEPITPNEKTNRIGILHIPMTAGFIINDGQHRRAAIETALREKPDLADESIAVVFFMDIGLERTQQMFADLNRHAIRPGRSLGLLYDHRDEEAKLTKAVVLKSFIFKNMIEMEKSSLAKRSRKLFTLSAIHGATKNLLANLEIESFDERVELAKDFWEEIAKQFKEWTFVLEGEMSAGEVREDFVHSHGITLHALGNVGNTLILKHPKGWRRIVKKIKTISWLRSNSNLWEGRSMIGGKMAMASHNITLATNAIKSRLKIPLTQEEKRVENAFKRGEYEKKRK